MRDFPIPLPARMKKLPEDARGFPTPFFVTWFNERRMPCRDGQGTPDFRVINPRKIKICIRDQTCWICGDKMGTYKSFVIGPMCAINRTISEPPSHHECAEFAARCCPFLSNPQAKRNERNMVPEHNPPPGISLERNPAVACVWTTKHFVPFKAEAGTGGSRDGTLFRLGEPTAVEWWAEGRVAKKDEVVASIASGFPYLVAVAEREGSGALRQLAQYAERVIPLLPEN